MKFQYTYRNNAFELWQLSMYYIYGSLAGVCNIIFTVALILLTVVKWNSLGPGLKVLLLFLCLWFPLFQPILIYRKALKQARAIISDTIISIQDNGVNVKMGRESSVVSWAKIKKISKKPTMIVIFIDTIHGYVLSDRVIGNDREELYKYLVSKVEKK